MMDTFNKVMTPRRDTILEAENMDEEDEDARNFAR